MKKWKVQVKGITTVEVIADDYEDAISQVKAATVLNKDELDWENLEINTKTIEVTNEEN